MGREDGDSPTDCGASRFSPEGSHERIVDFVRKRTKRPVVGVGRFTSPDTMVSQIRRGVLDLIGAARPSIADPFLPRKIDEGREDEIRECIGCNICISSWHDGVPVRCTQNPTAGEEWRRGWHPERIGGRRSSDRVLVVGAGPAGLECGLALAKRGYEVAIADAGAEPGGRLLFEAALPGLAEWRRVLDWRLGRLRQLPNVSLYRDSALTAEDVLEFGFEKVVVATGSRWTPELYSAMELPVPALARTAGVVTRTIWQRALRCTGRGRVRLRQLLHGRLRRRAAGRARGRHTYVRRLGMLGVDDHEQRAAARTSGPGAVPCRSRRCRPWSISMARN